MCLQCLGEVCVRRYSLKIFSLGVFRSFGSFQEEGSFTKLFSDLWPFFLVAVTIKVKTLK